MGGRNIVYNQDFKSNVVYDGNFVSNTINVVLFGKSGNGKSATGNSILGRNAFPTMLSLFGLTITCDLQSTKLKDGRVLNVIDTPELFDRSVEVEFTRKGIARCVELAKGSIHAILMVFSVRSRLVPELEVAIETLKAFFGEQILNYMIVVFTNGDELERFGLSLNEFIGRASHPSLQEFIQSCKGRIVVFDNKTCDEKKRAKQMEGLMYLVDNVIGNHFKKPFSDNILDELKEGALKLHEKRKEVGPSDGFPEQEISAPSTKFKLKQNEDNVEKQIEEKLEKLEKRLAEERGARLEAEKTSEKARIKMQKEICMNKEIINDLLKHKIIADSRDN